MIKIYIPLLCLILFTSCRPRLITKGIKDKTSNYIVTTGGKQIDASTVHFNLENVTADTATYAIDSVSAIKKGEAYYGVQDRLFYDGVYYGKLMLLRRYAGMSYDMNNHTSHSVYNYYLQKQGQPEIVDLTSRSLIDYVQDNPLALRKAKTSRICANVSIVSGITTIVGLSCVVLPWSSPIRKPAVLIGLFSMPTFLISLPVASHKRYKSIIVYNR